MILDRPIDWKHTDDKQIALDYIFDHQKITKVNQATLDQYQAKEENFIGLTPRNMFSDKIEYAKTIWTDLFDTGSAQIKIERKKADGSIRYLEGDYICLHDDHGKAQNRKEESQFGHAPFESGSGVGGKRRVKGVESQKNKKVQYQHGGDSLNPEHGAESGRRIEAVLDLFPEKTPVGILTWSLPKL